ncbi:MAG: cell division topological specificity factor MinE [Vulcanimicrobiaceae bacterium]
MFDFFKSFFRPEKPSSTTAKERLRLVLLSDHISLSPEIIESLKADLLSVISRYVEIDSDSADVTFEHRENEIAMLASVPITGLRDGRPGPPPPRGRAEPAAPAAPDAEAPAAAIEPAPVEASAVGSMALEAAPVEDVEVETSAPRAESGAEDEPGTAVVEQIASHVSAAVVEAEPEPAAASFGSAESEPVQPLAFEQTEAGVFHLPPATGKAARRRRRRKAARAVMLQTRLGGQSLGSPAQA